MTISIAPRDPILPLLHPTNDVQRAIDDSDLRADAIVQSIDFYAVEEDW